MEKDQNSPISKITFVWSGAKGEGKKAERSVIDLASTHKLGGTSNTLVLKSATGDARRMWH